jgi:allantoinase
MRAASIRVSDGRIAAIGAYTDRPAGVPEIDAGSHVVLPGLVDSHVHVNEPGRTDWEGFDHATRAAAAGGVTTIVDMPLNSIPPTTTVFGLEAKRRAAAGTCHVDVAFWGGVVPGNAGDLEALARAGVAGSKCFLSPSGVDEFHHVAEADLRLALPVLARLELPLLAHAELPERLVEPPASADPRQYSTWLASRPPASEHGAIDLLARLSREYGVHVHIVHLAASDALPIVRRARDAGAAITVETCPQRRKSRTVRPRSSVRRRFGRRNTAKGCGKV